MNSRSSPIAMGTGLAVLAAVAFAITTPAIDRWGAGAGPLSSAALLYLGAAASSLFRSTSTDARAPGVSRADVPRLAAMAVAGAGIAPFLLVWGLRSVGAGQASLLLSLEAFFTVVLARLIHKEELGRRVGVALVAMALGAIALTARSAFQSSFQLAGALAVAGASAAWALDNTLSRSLADHDPVTVVRAKAALGAALTTALAIVFGEPRPGLTSAIVLLACGATGYGLSLRFYLLAQRRIGAARTGSIFAIAPFLGAAIGWGLAGTFPGALALGAAALFALGVYLHATEHHAHEHAHESLTHEHEHSHDDGHHDHEHSPAFRGVHSHAHTHERVVHSHEHAPDVHHGHVHD